MLVSSCFLITLIKCLKGHSSLGVFPCKSKVKVPSAVSEWVSQWQVHLWSCSEQLRITKKNFLSAFVTLDFRPARPCSCNARLPEAPQVPLTLANIGRPKGRLTIPNASPKGEGSKFHEPGEREEKKSNDPDQKAPPPQAHLSSNSLLRVQFLFENFSYFSKVYVLILKLIEPGNKYKKESSKSSYIHKFSYCQLGSLGTPSWTFYSWKNNCYALEKSSRRTFLSRYANSILPFLSAASKFFTLLCLFPHSASLSLLIGTSHIWLEPLTFDWNLSPLIGTSHFSLF